MGDNRTLINKIKLKTCNNIDVFDGTLSNNMYSQYNHLRVLVFMKWKTNFYALCSLIYKYILISSDELYFNIDNNKKSIHNEIKTITKYKPIMNRFFLYNEIFIEFNIFKNIEKHDNILIIGRYDTITPIEILIYNNYNINNIKCVVCGVYDETNGRSSATHEHNKKQLERLKNIYEVSFIYFTDKLEKLLDIDLQNVNNYTLCIYNMFTVYPPFYQYVDWLNTLNIYIGMMMCLKYTKINGMFIIHLGSVVTHHISDIYLILKGYFKESYLYYPELSNLLKDIIVYGVFKDFKGIHHADYNKLMNVLFELLKLYPDNIFKTFNIYDKSERTYWNVNKPMEEDKTKRIPYIMGFLPYNTDYTEIIDFNTLLYKCKFIFIQKILHLQNSNPKDYESIKLPTKDQILSSIIYCRKYNIPIFNKLNITKQDTIITENILSDLYGLSKPILFKFNTPYQTHIDNKFMFNPKFKYIKTKSKTLINKSFSLNSLHKRKQAIKYNISYKINKSKSSKQYSTSSITKKHTRKSSKRNSSKILKYSIFSLNEAIFQSNNSLIQVDRLLDVRKDYTKDNPSEIYDKLKNELHYYKNESPHINKSKYSNVNYLCVKVQQLISDNNITLDWIKMYEIIIKCNLIPINRKGIFKSLHIGDTSGSFINCINNYIHNKTSYNAFEWISQFLKPKGDLSKDSITKYTSNSNMYKLINQHRESWDWGMDDTGDITNIENIKYYAKIAKQMDINLMTSDNILPQNDPKALQVAYASYVAILYALPINGTLLYKILSPIDIPLMWNLIYITYTNFKEMYFFKPVQNSRSREFYIIAKGYLGINQTILDKLLNLVKKVNNDKSTSTKKHNNTNDDDDDDDDYNANTDDNAVDNDNDDDDDDDGEFNKETYDLFNDTYPEEFVTEVQNICEHLSSNYVESIERIIYYVDNIDNLGDEYKKHIKSYITEKNDEWISEYKPEQLYKKFIL